MSREARSSIAERILMLKMVRRGVAIASVFSVLGAAGCSDEDPQAAPGLEGLPGANPTQVLPGADTGIPTFFSDAGAPGSTASSGTTAPGAKSGTNTALPAGDAGTTLPVPAVDAGGTSSPAAADGGAATGTGTGTCCPDGKCLCHGPAPTELTAAKGPYKAQNYTVPGVGCVYYPTDAEPPYAAVAVSDGFLGSGGCGSFQTGEWGPLYASWGIVAMIVDTGSGDQPAQRGAALTKGIETFKAENTKSGSPLEGKMSGRYGTSGFSMGGGGTTYSAQKDPSLLTDVAIMPWGPVRTGVTVPTLVVCGSSDGTAPCGSHGTPAYAGIQDTVPKMRIQITSGHAGQPSSGGGQSGKVGLAFQKVFLEGDQRWRPLLVAAPSEATNIK
jgi:hypothetical protein